MDISSKIKQVLIDLYSSTKGLYAYSLYSRYGLTPSEALGFMDSYKEDGIVTVDNDNRISLTTEGRNRIIRLINSISNSSEKKENYLERFRSSEYIEINAPYLPDEFFYIKHYAREADKTSQ